MSTRKPKAPDLRICLVSLPVPEVEGGHVLVLNLLRVLVPLADRIHLITGNYPEHDVPSPEVKLTNVRNDPLTDHLKRNLLPRTAKYVAAQVRMAYHLARISSKIDVVVFFIGGNGLVLPNLIARLRGKKTIVITAGSGAAVALNTYRTSFGGLGGLIASGICGVLERLSYRMCDTIVVYAPNLVSEFSLERYTEKIHVAHEHFLDFAAFAVQKPLCKRDDRVGYIGRLSQEKGILNFVEAIPRVLRTRVEVRFLIGGNGQLRNRVEEHAAKREHNIEYVGWLSRKELPARLNELKLLVLPSYTEGLPNILLEAMACGTPVLATPVGAVPDVIVDGETGFLMETNSPECIAENILRALSHPDLERIARNARAFVEREFTFESAVDTYGKILHSLVS